MRIKFLAMGAVAALALGVGAFGVSAFAAEPAPYKAPRLAFGQPDLGENWSNVSLTPETRRGSMANRAVLTEDEVKAIESGAVKALDDANQPTDPDAPAPTAGGDKPPPFLWSSTRTAAAPAALAADVASRRCRGSFSCSVFFEYAGERFGQQRRMRPLRPAHLHDLAEDSSAKSWERLPATCP